ncbi:MAG: thiopeptide-type bacteriocin biosynthesis protein [Tannerellaceae bacterium]|nr:thiopeptide-type bacteriocin biosynthesis protein [Tannerellaceae bacterium]
MNRKRRYYPGDHWVYYKIYAGEKGIEQLVKDLLLPVVRKMEREKLISRWFFLRYADPEFHLRVRFYTPDRKDQYAVMEYIYQSISKRKYTDLIYKVQIDTYEQEIERYGAETIDLSESLFSVDSHAIANLISGLQGEEDREVVRWQLALLLIDGMLEAFQLDIVQKSDCMSSIALAYKEEFQMINQPYSGQLNEKYRIYRKVIEQVMKEQGENELLMKYKKILSQRFTNFLKLAPLFKERVTTIRLNELLWSFMHMSMNRLFINKNRIHELVVYDFLDRYYKSEIAKRKYMG